MFDFFVHALQGPRVAGLSFAEPNLELCRGITDVRCEANVRRFDAVFVDINVQVLVGRNQNFVSYYWDF